MGETQCPRYSATSIAGQARCTASPLERLSPQQSPLSALQPTEDVGGAADAELAPVGLSVKLPLYWAVYPLWFASFRFAQVDAVLASRRIVSQRVMFSTCSRLSRSGIS